MVMLDESDDCVVVVEINAELRHAQLEILSAQLATDRLRLRFPVEKVARHGKRDVLQKALSSATALSDYYTSVVTQIQDPGPLADCPPRQLSEPEVLDAITRLTTYLCEQRERFRPMGLRLADEQRRAIMPFFSSSLLDLVRVVTLQGERIPNPPFYSAARARGFDNLPEVTHMASLTFADVLVFHEEIAPRQLFHALVQAVQFQVLGVEKYAELFVRSFLRVRSHVNVPLEAHAFMLDATFAADSAQPFSVEDKVRLWAELNRY